MRESDEWVVLDTETTGLRNPIYPVEISAQIMRGWEPSGEPFRVLLNFDVPIEPMAEKIHGYSRDYLAQYGTPPEVAFAMCFDYMKSLRIVAYNLIYDWNRVLAPTLERMRARATLNRGFCALNLTRHVVPALSNFQLKTVIRTFGLAAKQEHRADSDVNLVVQFMSQHLGPHLTRSNVVGFKQVAACADGAVAVPPLEPPLLQGKARKRKTRLDKEAILAIGELIGICRVITLDNRFTADELNFLANWLERCPNAGVPPISSMFDLVREIVADKKVTLEEQARLSQAIEELVTWRP